MQSEDRMVRRRLQSDSRNSSQTTTDYQNAGRNDVLYNTITFGLAAITGYGLLKTGALKPIAKGMLELADTVARDGSDRAVTAMRTLEDWTKLQRLAPDQLASSAQTKNPPRYSLFRDRDKSFGYNVFEDLKGSYNSSRIEFRNTRRVLDDTLTDVRILTQMIEERQSKLSNKRNNFTNTEFYAQMTDYLSMKRDLYSNASRNEAHLYSDKGMEELIKEMTLTPEQAKQQLRETGYKAFTFGDALEIIEDNGHKLVLKKDAKLDLSKIYNNDGESLLDVANDFFKNNYYGGNKTPLSTNAWKNIIIDSNIRISEDGKIIDYRMSEENFNWMMKSLAKDFGLPLVKFSPGKIIGLDKIGRKKPLMGVIWPGQYGPDITRQAGRVEMGDWLGKTFGEQYKNRPVPVINGKAYIVDEDGKLKVIADRLKLHDITNADKNQGLTPLHNASRQISGLSTGEAPRLTEKEIEQLGPVQRFKYKMGEMLDLGRHEIRPNDDNDFEMSLDSMSNIDKFVDKLISTVGDSKVFRVNGFEYDNVQDFIDSLEKRNYKTLYGQGLDEYYINGRKIKPRTFSVTKEGFKFGNILKEVKSKNFEAALEEAKGFRKQFFVGQNKDGTMNKYFTERSGILFTVLNQLNEGLAGSSRLLGLSIDSKKSSSNLFWNLLTKRALPVYLLTQIPGMLNYFSEPFFGGEDENGNRDNITKFLMREVVKPIDVKAHHAMDLVGATKVFKFLGEMVPGSDQINELPGVYQLGLGQTKEERKEYIENGYDPVRKGRYWGSGNTPFTGGKIMYFRPNIYRRVEADAEFSDSKWGSRQEYYNNTWFPNPVNPLAPLNHFVFNKNHYDKKHYYDRPYLQTAPAGQNIPVIGPIFSSTIGRVISPPKKMHLEYWENGLAINPEDEKASTLVTEGRYYEKENAIMNHYRDIGTYNDIQQNTAVSNKVYFNDLYTSAYQAKQVTSRNAVTDSGITFESRNILPMSSSTTTNLPINTYSKYNTPYEVYSTPSGALNVVDVPDEMNLYNVNKDLQHYSINKVIGTNQRVIKIDDFQGPDIPVGNDSPSVDNAFIYGLGEQFNTLADVAGLKGFALQAFVTGEANEKARVIEDSGYAYSFNDNFWEENLGGLGGGLSEITRRFIPKRNSNVEYVNPIRNTMPSWMPGSNYFTDFKHGDPYSKIDNGEERLPGEGYERLHDIKPNMWLGASTIGYEQDYIIKKLLNGDPYTDSFEQETLDKGNEIHSQVEKEWMESGFAINVEQEVKDERNQISGRYDALVRDPTSLTGVAIIDIKSTSAKKLEEIRKSKKPLTHHMRQTNYYLWATGNTKSKGYIHYVDKENPDNTYTVGFAFSPVELTKTLNNVYEARKAINKGLESGEIGRGELYNVLDRFRILADVAPYSQEYKDASALLEHEDLSADEKREVQQIRKRVEQQKEPLRVYPYKFKTSNLKSETVTITKVLDNNTFVTKEYGKEHAIKFAGMNVSESNSEFYKTWDETFIDKKGRKRTRKTGITKNDAARKEIRKYIRPGSRITISYDADERNKFSKDSTESIKAVIKSRGVNVNRVLLNKGLANEKENDNTPASIRARYSSGEIAFGSAMETLTHDIIGRIPFVGSKIMQVRSPYEQYRRREVYGKDFQSWNHPIRDIVIPQIETSIANSDLLGIGGVISGAFIGSMFGKNKYGKIVGATVGGLIPAIGKIAFTAGSTEDRDWRPKRRREQEQLNEYVDVLKYVKNMRLYEQYKLKAKKEDNFDVESFIESKEYHGVQNKLRQQELNDYKKKVKLDFKHRDKYNFKYGAPKYAEKSMTQKETVRAINKELSEIQSQRKVTKLPTNALKAIEFKQAAEQTMYAYDPGDSLVDIMSALPKKERQYFKHFVDAPEEEKEKILKIAPSYLRRALQTTWGMPVDKKPSLNEYFSTHGLPDASWIGWDEDASIDDIKVKLVHQNKLDPGEFDIWDADIEQADQVNIPIPQMEATNNPREVQVKLSQILGKAGYENVQINYLESSLGNSTTLNVKRDARNEVAQQIEDMEI